MSRIVRMGNMNQYTVATEESTMVFSKDNYDNDMKALKAAMADFIMTLMENEYECRVRADDFGIGVFIVEYAHDNNNCDDDWGNDRLMWISSEEQDLVYDSRADAASAAENLQEI